MDEVHKLGEVLRTAREAKGVDLPRVERETKIRERYLSALERGEYRELPGAVYTKGFLRNYGAYLGLDPEYLIDLYRLESAVAAGERPRVPAPPRPLAARRQRGFVVTPGAVVAAILTLLVGGFVAYLGFEFVNFARTPELRIIDPPGNVNAHPTLEITVRGVTEPNATVAVRDLPENPTVTADADGRFEVTVQLVPGSNVMTLVATDPETGRSSEEEVRTVLVATEVAESPSPSPVAVEVTEPAADASVRGAIRIVGHAAPGASVTAEATLTDAAQPTFTVVDATGRPVPVEAAPRPPEPVSMTADDAGAFSGRLGLAPGTWEVRIVPEGGEPITRRVTVSAGDGLSATLRLAEGDSYLEIAQDGTPVGGTSGTIASAGERVDLRATRELRIRAGNAGAVRLTVNGVAIGAMGADGAVVEWRITRTDG
jgi:cytoskeletal protein RodZ